jgi:DNA uptake protein ComE-like DNA-binding protein
MRRILLSLVLACAVAIPAGCGGGDGGSKTTTNSKADAAYMRELAQTGATLQKTFGDISDQTGSNTSSAQIAARLEKGAAAVQQSADNFAKITPPAAAKSAHQELVEGLREIAGQLSKAADAARKNDSKTLAAALQSLLSGSGSQKLAQAEAELQKQGLVPKPKTTTSTTPTTTTG